MYVSLKGGFVVHYLIKRKEGNKYCRHAEIDSGYFLQQKGENVHIISCLYLDNAKEGALKFLSGSLTIHWPRVV